MMSGFTDTVGCSSSTDPTATSSATQSGIGTTVESFTYPFTATDAGVHVFWVTFDPTDKQMLTV